MIALRTVGRSFNNAIIFQGVEAEITCRRIRLTDRFSRSVRNRFTYHVRWERKKRAMLSGDDPAAVELVRRVAVLDDGGGGHGAAASTMV